VIAAVKAQRSEQMAAAAAQAAVKSVDGGQTMDQLARSLGSTVSGPKPVARSDQAVPLELREALFMAPKPAGKPVVRTVKLGNGDAAIFAFTGIKQDPLQDIQARQLRRQYADALADTEAMDYANAVRAAAKVELNPQALE